MQRSTSTSVWTTPYGDWSDVYSLVCYSGDWLVFTDGVWHGRLGSFSPSRLHDHHNVRPSAHQFLEAVLGRESTRRRLHWSTASWQAEWSIRRTN